MSVKQDARKMGEEAMNSFRRRLKANRELVGEVDAMIRRFRDEHREMAARLSSNADLLHSALSADEQERIGRYDEMMGTIRRELGGIRDAVSSCRREASAMMEGFGDERCVMSAGLHAFLDEASALRREGEAARLAGFAELMADIRAYNESMQREVGDIFASTSAMLERFAGEHEQMAAELMGGLDADRGERSAYTRELLQGIRGRMKEISDENLEAAARLRKGLESGEAQRMAEYRELFGRISSEFDELRRSTAAMLQRYSEERAADAAGWPEAPAEAEAASAAEEAVAEAGTPAPEEDPAAEAAPAADEEPEAAPVAEVPAAEPEAESASLEERVLDFINATEGGVRVSEMEKPLGETRMKIGIAARNLLDAGAVVKIDSYYHRKIR